MRKLFLLLSLFFHDSTLGSLQLLSPGGLSSVLVLDIDGTVYDDECQIEQQIRDNCHIFASTFGYSASDSEDMHHKFGSTIRGICEYGQPRTKFLDYYNDVYPHLDMSLLRKYSSVSSEGNTGYNIAMGGALNSLHRLDCPIVVASNSPVFHVKRVLTRLGLSKLKISAFITPERRSGLTKNEPRFWDPLFELYPQDRFLCTLVDDNGLNVKLVRELGNSADKRLASLTATQRPYDLPILTFRLS
jgi:beta-phosphoglucomutase-like phosphatase (HAD superfamily)